VIKSFKKSLSGSETESARTKSSRRERNSNLNNNTENDNTSLSIIYNVVIIEEKSVSDSPQQNNNINDIDKVLLSSPTTMKIFKKFLKLINDIFQENSCIFNDKNFIKTIFSLQDIQAVLNKTNLNLSLRTEILRYFRVVYLDVNFSFMNLEKYKSEFMQSTESENSLDFKSQGMKILLFYQNLYKISSENRHKDDSNINNDPLSKFLSTEYEILLFECENFEKIIGNSLWNHDRDKDKDYFIYYLENGVLLPMKIFFSKIFSLVLHLNGREFLKIYNLIYNSMLMKKYILENRYIFKPAPKKDLFNKFYKKEEKENPKNQNLKRRKYEIADPDIFEEYELEVVKKVIHQITDLSYRAFDYNLLYDTVKKHFLSMLKPPKSKSLTSLFDKHENLTKQEQERLTKEMTEKNLLKNNIEKKYFDIIIKYQNSKKSLINSCLIENLSDLNTVYDVNYRHLILKSLLKSLSSTSVSFLYYKEYYLIVLKFLQFDTAKSQFEIRRLNEENKNIINFDILVNNFFASLLDVIFSSYYPSNKEDYFMSLNIIKILKYLCEEHNNYFQSILLKKLTFFYNGKAASFFDFLMMVINRIILISGWEGYSENEIYSDFFYDIFSCLIELVIEMIQGTNSENFSLILNDNFNEKKKLLMNFQQEDKINSLERERKSSKLLLYSQMIQDENKEKAFILFINSIKPIILNENSASAILFKVKTDLANLLLAFLEDRECPRHIKLVIVKNFPTQPTLNTICKSLKLFYIRIKEEQKTQFMCGSSVKPQDSCVENSVTGQNIYNVNVNKQLHFKALDKYKLKLNKTLFDNKVYDMLVRQYFKDEEFSESAEFKFTSTLFSFVKLIAIENYNYEAFKVLDKAKNSNESTLMQSLNNIKQKKFKPKSEEISKEEKDSLSLSQSGSSSSANPFAYLKSENQEYLIENYFLIKFFEKVTRTIQVQIGDYTTPVIFSLPPKVIYLSLHTKKNFIKNVNRENRLTKLIDLLNYSEYFKDEVVYNFVKGKSNFLFRFSNAISYYWISYFTFIFVFFVNIYMIVYYRTELAEFQELEISASSHRLLSVSASEIIDTNLTDTNTTSTGWILSNFKRRNDEGITSPLFYLSLLHFFFNLIFMILWSITKLPLYFSNAYKRTKDLMKVDDKQISKTHKLSLIIQEIFNREESVIFVWNIIFSVIFMFLPSFEFLFSLQLLLVIHLSSTLKNIVLSFKLRSLQFLNTFILLLIFNYLYSVLAFFFIRDEFYDANFASNDCESLLMCFIYIFSNGLKRHGGIGDVIKLSSFLWDEGHFWGLLVYKMLYFIICVVLLLNIIFGIIINTFTELRLKDSEKHYDKVNRCFICGEEKDDLEKIGEKFDQHTGEEHNFWNYVYYIIKLKFSDIQDLNAINASVMQRILENDISWIPSRKIIPSREEVMSKENYVKSAKSNRDLTVVIPAKKKSSLKDVTTMLNGTLPPVIEE
jgi:hypothetical protein